jgi:hypothetical protein
MRYLAVMALVSSIIGLLGLLLSAQTLPVLPPPPAPSSSVVALASELAAALDTPPMPRGTRLSIAVKSTLQTARPGLEPLVSDALEAALRRRGATFTRSLRDKATELIDIEFSVVEGHLLSIARRRSLPLTLWQALANPSGAVVATATSNLPIDLELRTLLGLPLRAVRLDDLRVVPVGHKSALRDRPILDCAVADLDADRLPELLLLEPSAVHALQWRDGGFQIERGTFSLDALPPSKARLRDPLGRMVVITRPDGGQILVAASSDRAESAILTLEQNGLVQKAIPLQRGWPLYATNVDSLLIAPWPEALDSLEGGLTEARLGTTSASWVGSISRFHAVYGPAPRVTIAARVGGGLELGRLEIRDAGLAVATSDLDADGRLELLTTSTALSGPDRLTLRSLETPSRVFWSGVAPSPVTALCEGDVDRDGFDEYLAATWDGKTSDILVVVPK